MSQFDKDDIDDMGLLKLDILGVRMQSTIAYTIAEIERMTGEQVDVEAIPLDDEPTFENIRSTHTLGVFQIESPGQRELVGKMQPDSFTDLVADISLFRPGPMKANMITPYVEVKLGFRSPPCLHPRFRDFLADTYGVVVYHEHVMRIFAESMGISLAEADAIRRNLGWDKDNIERAFRQKTRARTDDQGRPLFNDRQIERTWGALESFGSFGFCKAHAAAFAVTTYQSAWLKTHYPVEFMAGILEHDPGMYPKRLLVAEARRLGIPILGVDVNASSGQYRVESIGTSTGVRMPFTQIKGISSSEVHRLVDAQPYVDLIDVIQRARPARPTLRNLALIGAFDTLAPARSRGEIIAQVRHLTARPLAVRSTEQSPLITEDGLPTFEPAPETDPVAAEMEILGIDLTHHVLDPWRETLDEIGVTPANELLAQRNDSTVIVAGIRVASGTPPTKSGTRVVFISLDDGTGIADCAFFDDAQHQIGPDLFTSRLLAVQGVTRRTGEKGVSITATKAWDFTRGQGN